MGIEAVIFDLDGVLVDSAINHFRSYNEALRPLGITIDWSYYLTIMGLRREDALRKVAADYRRSFDITQVAQAKDESYRRLASADPRPIGPMVALVRRLKDRLPLALATGAHGPIVPAILDAIGLSDCFRVIVTGRDVQQGKPEPDSFLLAAEWLGVPPARCLVIEDSPEGVAAAKAAGMRCIAVLPPGLTPAALPAADLIVPDRSEASAHTIEQFIAARRAKGKKV